MKWVPVLALFLFACAKEEKVPSFVKVENGALTLDGKPYHFIGTNFWYGMNLGSKGDGGDRERLTRELDRLKGLGLTNLRIMGSTEGPDSQPYRSIPALQTAPGVYNDDLLEGLDYLLAEMAKRDMKAVVCLNNYWMWSGGFPQYVSWADSSAIPYPDIEGGSTWDPFIFYSLSFYKNEKAQELYEDHLDFLIGRTNTVTGTPYTDDPTIMSWQMANEPRGYNTPEAHQAWLKRVSKFIKERDKNHLVSTGTEGNTNTDYSGIDLTLDHDDPNVDYCTSHVWIQNWGWFDPSRPETFDSALVEAKMYLDDQMAQAKKLGKPIVLEEFGVSRDAGAFEDTADVNFRNRFYEFVFDYTLSSIESGDPIKGCNFWAWGGEGRPNNVGGMWKSGDDFIGDPPHELQGWYSVYDQDSSTIELIQNKMARL